MTIVPDDGTDKGGKRPRPTWGKTHSRPSQRLRFRLFRDGSIRNDFVNLGFRQSIDLVHSLQIRQLVLRHAAERRAHPFPPPWATLHRYETKPPVFSGQSTFSSAICGFGVRKGHLAEMQGRDRERKSRLAEMEGADRGGMWAPYIDQRWGSRPRRGNLRRRKVAIAMA